jgi:CheY-like chemotaxis protein
MANDQDPLGAKPQTCDDLGRDGLRRAPDFLASLARDVRGPLVSLATALAVFERYAPRDSNEERAREVARRATAALGHIANLIDPWSHVEVLPPVVDESPRSRPTRVLIIEDNEDLRTILTDLCRLLGHDVCAAGEGVDGVATALRQVPDIALIDIGLPDIDGCEVARRIREDPRGAGIQLVAMTAYSSAGQRASAAAAGFRLYVLKSASIEELVAALAACTS